MAAERAASLARTVDRHELPTRVYLDIYASRRPLPGRSRAVQPAWPQLDVDFVHSVCASRPPRPHLPFFGSSASEPFEMDGITVRARAAEARRARMPEDGFFLYRSPGFISRAWGAPVPPEATRIYLALRASDARWFLNDAFEALRRGLRGFAMKTLANPRNYARADAAVVYVPTDVLQTALELMQFELASGGIMPRAETPLGTNPVSGGMAWADSPIDEAETSTSFGQWITSLLLEAERRFGSGIDRDQLARLCTEKGRELDRIYRRNSAEIRTDAAE